MSQKTVACLIFYNLKKREQICIIFGTLYMTIILIILACELYGKVAAQVWKFEIKFDATEHHSLLTKE